MSIETTLASLSLWTPKALLNMKYNNSLSPMLAACFLTTLLSLAGCNQDSSQTATQPEPIKEDPPILTAPAGPAILSEEDVHERLKKDNPDYQNNAEFGKVKGEIISVNLFNTKVENISALEGLKLQYLDLTNCPVADLSPLKGMKLQELYLEGTYVSDLRPLKGMPIQILRLEHTPISDISPLEGMPLNQLNLFDTKVKDLNLINTLPLKTLWIPKTEITDITPLKGMLLESLDIQDTKVADISPLKGMQFLRLNLANSEVTDLTPLKGMPLQRLIFTPSKITKGMDIIRENQSIQGIGTNFENVKAAAEFWKEYDLSQSAKKK
ncbi:Internalin-A precursor [Gimesia alba]|uniref:Internalin-A n=1 Tax=Gimesia alba TaxID=2527973 RepID=A0A517RIV7_9PLAN|nr:leucine-rich repeat domain-containing protein [Gimesia alba]QDT43803.1 Internalin-A precursor [Gimesia alba]